MTDYQALMAYGHSPAKAAEIILDANRGDEFCRRWIEAIRALHEMGRIRGREQ